MASRVKSLYAVPVVLAVVAAVILAVSAFPALARGHHWRPWHVHTSPSHAPSSLSPFLSAPAPAPSSLSPFLSAPAPVVSSPAPITSSPDPSTGSPASSPATPTPGAPGSSTYPANESTTGYQNAPGYPGTLTDCAGLTLRSDTAYKWCDFPSGLVIPVGITGVTFTGCRFASNAIVDANVADYGSGITFEYDTFEPSAVPAGSEPAINDTAHQIPYSQGYQYGIDQRGRGGALTVDHSRFWGFANAMQVWSSTAAARLTITNSLFSNPRADGGTDHTDGPGVLNSGSTLTGFVVENNTIIGIGNANGLAFQPQGTTNHYVDGTVTGNYFSGYGFTVALGSGTETTGTVFEDNTWGTDIKPAAGPLYNGSPFNTPGLGNTWSGNKIHVVPGTTWMAAASDGMYWWPSDGNPAGSSSAAGHATDFPNP